MNLGGKLLALLGAFALLLPMAQAGFYDTNTPYDQYERFADPDETYPLYTEDELAAKWEKLRERYPDGCYWNYPVDQPYWDEDGAIVPELYEATTDHPCDGERYTCKEQCVGFAWMLADLLYRGQATGDAYSAPGYTPLDAGQVTQLLPGDIIAIHNGALNHEAIVYQVEDGEITVAECWSSSRSGCRISWGPFNGARSNATLDGLRALAGEDALYIFRRPPTVEDAQSVGEEAQPAASQAPEEAPSTEPEETPSTEPEEPQPTVPAVTVPSQLAAQETFDPTLAYPSTQTVWVDGQPVVFQCYALKNEAGYDTNYIRLRDLADILRGTPAQFEVGWDHGVFLTSNAPYTPNGSEYTVPFTGARPYDRAAAKTTVDGAETPMDAFQLADDDGGGYTYYKLRDLGAALGFSVDWSALRGISIQTA